MDDGYRSFRPEILEGLEPTRKRPHGCCVPEGLVTTLSDEEMDMIMSAPDDHLPDDRLPKP